MRAISGTNHPPPPAPLHSCRVHPLRHNHVSPITSIINQPWREDRTSHRSCYLEGTAKLPSYESTVI